MPLVWMYSWCSFGMIRAKRRSLRRYPEGTDDVCNKPKPGVQKGVSKESLANFSVLKFSLVLPSFLNLFLCSSGLSVPKHRDIKVCCRVIWGFLRDTEKTSCELGPGLWPQSWSPVSKKWRATTFAGPLQGYLAGVFVLVLFCCFLFYILASRKSLACALWIPCSLWFEAACLGSYYG